MTPPRALLTEAIRQWSDSATRIEAERDHQKALTEKVVALGVTAKTFRAVAAAWHRDQAEATRIDLSEAADLLEWLLNLPAQRVDVNVTDVGSDGTYFLALAHD